MRISSACTLLTAWLVSGCATPAATAVDPNAPKPIRASKIILVGESTTAVQGGWGLVTPLTRRMFKDGVLKDDLGPWAETTRRVAAEMGVPLVDLHELSRAAIQAMGPTAATAALALAVPDLRPLLIP